MQRFSHHVIDRAIVASKYFELLKISGGHTSRKFPCATELDRRSSHLSSLRACTNDQVQSFVALRLEPRLPYFLPYFLPYMTGIEPI